MVENAVHAEKLHFTELPAQIDNEMKRFIHVLAWVRQVGTDGQYPAVDRGRNKKLLAVRAGHAFFPGTGDRIMHAQGGLHNLEIIAFDREPAGRDIEHRRLKFSPLGQPMGRITPAEHARSPLRSQQAYHNKKANGAQREDNEEKREQNHGDPITVSPGGGFAQPVQQSHHWNLWRHAGQNVLI